MSILNKKGRPFKNERDSLGKLYSWFLEPLFRNAPEGIDDFTYLEALFGIRTRVFERYSAKKEFVLPGYYLEVANCRMQGRGYRAVVPGDELFVRKDPVLGRLHVSFFGGKGNEEQTFELTQSEWESIERFLEEVPDPCNHYHDLCPST